MISINKQEAEMVRKHCPENHIRRTCKQKSKRHHYHMSEDLAGVQLVATMRGTTVDQLIRM